MHSVKELQVQLVYVDVFDHTSLRGVSKLLGRSWESRIHIDSPLLRIVKVNQNR